MLSIEDRMFVISAWFAAWAVASFTPELAESRARLRALTSRLLISFSAPSPVCTSVTALFVLSIAVFRPAIWARCCSEITRAAGPSAPRLILRPVESRSSEVDRAELEAARFCCAVRDERLLTIGRDIAVHLHVGMVSGGGTAFPSSWVIE